MESSNNKIIWGAVVLVLLGIGAWRLLRNEDAPSERPLAEKAIGTHYVGGGMHTIEGTVTLPNPCYSLSVATEKRNGAPEEALLRFTANKTSDVCVQVVHNASFRTAFSAADNAALSAEINGIPFALELTRRERVSAREGVNFSIGIGEDRWVEDLHIIFNSIKDDNRCAVDVTCIQAGWATLQFMAALEEIMLRHPGDASAPNAVVVGSYIITLVEVEPAPRSDEPQEGRAYRATLRVEVHDIKG